MTSYRDADQKAREYLRAFKYERATDDARRTARALARALGGLPVDKREKEAIRAAGCAALFE